MTCALERVKEIELLEENKVKFSPKLRAILKPEVYFEHCFGIIRQFVVIGGDMDMASKISNGVFIGTCIGAFIGTILCAV